MSGHIHEVVSPVVQTLSQGQWVQGAVALTALSDAFAASFHCVGMCGGLILGIRADRGRRFVFYQVGRLMAYIGLGAMVGGIGGAVLFSFAEGWGNEVAAYGLGLTFTLYGLRLWGGRIHRSLLPTKLGRGVVAWRSGLVAKASGASWAAAMVGAMSALLPCGLLHGFLLGAAATGGPAQGGIVMAAVWLGTLPALAVGKVGVRAALARLPGSTARWAGALFVAAGFFTIWARFSHHHH